MKVNSILYFAFICGALSHLMQDQGKCCACNKCARNVIGIPRANMLCPDNPSCPGNPLCAEDTVCQHRNDCSTFQVKTIVPTPVIRRKYTTTTISSKVVPNYASGCANCQAYSSACSCWNITSTVTTLPTPTTTVTLTVTKYASCGDTPPINPYICDDPGVCGSFDFIEDERCGNEGQCACSFDLSGDPICLENVDCDKADKCEEDDDCDGKLICWRYSCCGRNVCAKPSEVCADTSLARLGSHGGQKVLLPTGRNDEI